MFYRIRKNIRELLKKQFIRNVTTVATGTAMAQVIVLIFSPVITRIYGPEAYGVFGVFSSILSIFLPIAALTYPDAIVLPKNDSEAKGLIRLSIYTNIAISMAISIVFAIFGNSIVEVFQIGVLKPYLLFIPLMMFFGGMFQIVQQWLIRKKMFKVKAKVAVQQSLILNGSHSGLGLLYPSSTTLIVTATFGKGLYALMLAWAAGIHFDIKKFLLFTKKTSTSFFALSKKYNDFPKYRAPQVFINGVSENLPILLLTTFFGPAAAGFYTIGMKVLSAPTQLIGNAVGDVFYPRISEAANNGESISKILLKANLVLIAVGFIPFGIIILFGPWIFSFVFGAEWVQAGVYARWLALGSYFTFVTRPTIKTLPVLGEQRFHLAFTIMTVFARLSAVIVGGFILTNDVATVALYSIVGVILYSLLGILTIIKSKVYQNR